MSAIDDLCRSYLDLKWHFDPAAASSAGAVSEDGRLGSYDADGMRAHLSAFRAMTAAVEEADPDDLQDEVDRTALLDEIRSVVSRFEVERPHVRNPEFWLSHLFQGVYALLSRPAGSLAERAPAAVARLKEAPAFLDAARATIKNPPVVFVDTALGMLGGGGELLVQMAAALSEVAPELAPEVTTATRDVLESLTRFGRALTEEIEPDGAPRAFAIGEDQFDHRLHQEHALRATAPEFWRYGLHLQEEVEREVARLARAIDSGKPWRDVVEKVRDQFPGGDGLLSLYAGEAERARLLIEEKELMALPDAALEILPTPAFMAPLVPFAAYEPPPVLLPGTPGRFFVTEPDRSAPPEARERQLRAHSPAEIPSTVAHEAWPGHHLQLLTAQALPSEVRRHVWTPLMVEGWALYAEELMAESGFFQTPESMLLHGVNLLWRAVRILVDVGLHTRDMTASDAIKYLTDHVPMDRAQAEAEVRRYCAMPTYQLCYAVGRRELLSLRHDYRERAGSDFSLSRFHSEVLAYGGLPVSLIRWGMGLEEP